MLKNHPCILDQKALYTEENQKYLRENRLSILKKGEVFPKISEKVRNIKMLCNHIYFV